jgi:hypothetical protein
MTAVANGKKMLSMRKLGPNDTNVEGSTREAGALVHDVNMSRRAPKPGGY